MAHLLLHAISHSLEDVIKSAPILLVVYAVLYWLEHKMRAAPALLEKAQKVGPVIGGLAGSVPQCGFSAAASALFAEGFLHPATLRSAQRTVHVGRHQLRQPDCRSVHWRGLRIYDPAA